MGSFLEVEKSRQSELKAHSSLFGACARKKGLYKGKLRTFCLPTVCAEENLSPQVRSSAMKYFHDHEIGWHDGREGKPSNHLCDSQVCCVNFLFPFADKPVALADLFRKIFPDLREVIPTKDKTLVSFEWIGEENYLKEKTGPNGRRTRGANATSADALVAFVRNDGRRQVVLIEWKYTESYGNNSVRFSKNGTDRSAIYKPYFQSEDCPLVKELVPSFDALFYEPFYQLMREQLLAHEMERAGELEASIVSVLHISPAHNRDFLRITSPTLVGAGKSAVDVWKKLVRSEERFASISTEEMFAGILSDPIPELREWQEYLCARYPWVLETEEVVEPEDRIFFNAHAKAEITPEGISYSRASRKELVPWTEVREVMALEGISGQGERSEYFSVVIVTYLNGREISFSVHDPDEKLNILMEWAGSEKERIHWAIGHT